MNTAVSTVAFDPQQYSIEKIIEAAKRHNWTIEFSSGLEYRTDLIDIYRRVDIPRLPHNYFPPPKNPFVLNLASLNETVRKMSIQHCINALTLARESGSPFYSVHAGFCGDPRPEELGQRIRLQSGNDRRAYWEAFTLSIQELLEFAEKIHVNLLIENNVCAPFNLVEPGVSPFLCTHPDEIVQLFDTIAHPRFGFLLDTGHFKVSSVSLEFALDQAVNTVGAFTKAIHHSDNDGTKDDNQKLPRDYWFLKHMAKFTDATHILEVKCLTEDEIEQQISLLIAGAV